MRLKAEDLCPKSIRHVSPKLLRRRGSCQLVANRHNRLLSAPIVTDLLRTCPLCCGLVSDTTGKSSTCDGLAIAYGETGVMDFGLRTSHGAKLSLH